MSVPKVIESDEAIPFDQHTRVTAGPGAGKTYWLIEQLTHVVRHSRRLGPTRRIACISYTNAAAEEIQRRLGDAAEYVEVSTIHGFLYRNIVKPYLHLSVDDDGQRLVPAYADVDGHDQHRPNYPCVSEWLTEVDQKTWLRAKKRPEIMRKLRDLRWALDDEGSLCLKPRDDARLPPSLVPHLGRYRVPYWQRGVIDHEDVLYFAHSLLMQHAALSAFLSARFPYVFVDEFQDTNPIQTAALKRLAANNTLVTVVGDPEQAIYGFQGAAQGDFAALDLPGITDYRIEGNWRSTDRIIQVIDHVRAANWCQLGMCGVEGQAVTAVVGGAADAADWVAGNADACPAVVLTRSNDEAALLRGGTARKTSALWRKVSDDLGDERGALLQALIGGSESARHGRLAEGVKIAYGGIRARKGQLRKPLKCARRITALERRSLAVAAVLSLLQRHGQLCSMSLLDAYRAMGDLLGQTIDGVSLSVITSGKPDKTAKSVLYKDLVAGAWLDNDERDVRTVHKAKGQEFPTVLVCFDDCSDDAARQRGEEREPRIEHLLDPHRERDAKAAEQKRVTYVALSRARDRLFIAVPSLTDEQESCLDGLHIDVVRL